MSSSFTLKSIATNELIPYEHNKGKRGLRRFRDACGLQFLLTTQMQDLMKSQKTVQDAVKSLEGPASQTVIDEVTICHLRPVRLPLNK